MGGLLGPVGGLKELRCATSLASAPVSDSVLQVVQGLDFETEWVQLRAGRPARSWTVNVGSAEPADMARLAELEAEGPILARARGGRAPWTFLLNGAPLAIGLARPEARLPHPGPGFARLTVIDGAGASDTAAIRLHMPEIPAN